VARIVEAVATFAGAGRLGRGPEPVEGSAAEIEAAMAAAAQKAFEDGTKDPDKVRALILSAGRRVAARERVKQGG